MKEVPEPMREPKFRLETTAPIAIVSGECKAELKISLVYIATSLLLCVLLHTVRLKFLQVKLFLYIFLYYKNNIIPIKKED